MNRLSPRQRQVAELTADGKGRKEIARLLGISADRVGEIIERVAEIVCDPDDHLEPRLAVFLFVHQQRWEAARRAEETEQPVP
jgi:DNA-binding NarL/FixJ family response regulator